MGIHLDPIARKVMGNLNLINWFSTIMLGAIAGDVLGSVHEFNPVKSKDFDLFDS